MKNELQKALWLDFQSYSSVRKMTSEAQLNFLPYAGHLSWLLEIPLGWLVLLKYEIHMKIWPQIALEAEKRGESSEFLNNLYAFEKCTAGFLTLT